MPSHDVLETLAVALTAGLACQLAADALRIPRMVLLLVAGVALGPHALDAIELPLNAAGARVRAIQAFHMSPSPSDPSKPWCDIAYNFLVCKHGFVFVGRGWKRKSAATGAANAHTISVCYVKGRLAPDAPFRDRAQYLLQLEYDDLGRELRRRVAHTLDRRESELDTVQLRREPQEVSGIFEVPDAGRYVLRATDTLYLVTRVSNPT